MTLAELYERDIDRSIDPVAKVDNRRPEVVQQEIEEYFFTDQLFDHLHAFLDTLLNGAEETTGFWINGYYGSGKSHFLKYIYYCLSEEHSEAALDHFEEKVRAYEGSPLEQPVTEADVKNVRRGLDGRLVDTIMFNIKNVSKQHLGEDTVTETFFNRFNHHRGYHKSDLRIARFEQQLDEEGTLVAFEEAVEQQTGDAWDEKALSLVDFRLDQVIAAVEEATGLDPEATRAALERRADYSIDEFGDEIERYLQAQPEGYRLVFIVDEVSQFMQGQTQLLLGLQTLVEMIGQRFQDQVWVVCTAQQKLRELAIAATTKKDVQTAYGRIIARFEKLPLKAQQADWIAKKRILEKSEKGERELDVFYEENKAPITGNFRHDKDAYPGYASRAEFVGSYPLVPYQFKLILQIIQSFDRAGFFVEGVSGTERSLIGITHETARGCKAEELGYVTPLDAFYGKQITDSLTFEARNMVDKGLSLPKVKEDPFWQRVVKALFLLSNITKDKKANFRATADNLTFVLYDEIDPNKKALARRVQEVLDHLMEQNVVSETDGEYRFLQEEEIRVKNEIDAITVRRDARWRFLESLLDDTVRWSQSAKLEGSKIRLHLKVDEHEASSSGTVPVQFLVMKEHDPQQLAFDRAKADLVFCLNEVFGPEERRMLDEVVRVDEFVRHNKDQAAGERREAIELFQKRSRTETLPALKRWLEEAIASCSYISAQSVYDASKHAGASAAAKYESILEEHLERLYPNRKLATPYPSKRKEVKAAAARTQQELTSELTAAEREMHSYLRMEPSPTLQTVLGHFRKEPFGWTDTEVLGILLALEQRNKWRFKYNSEEIGRKTFAEKGVLRSEQASITLHEQEDIDPTLLHQVRQAVDQRIFNESVLRGLQDPRHLRRALNDELEERAKHYEGRAADHEGRPFAHHFTDLAGRLRDLGAVPDAKTQFQQVVQAAGELARLVDGATRLEEFLNDYGKDYRAMQRFVREHRSELDALEGSALEHARKLRDYVRTGDEPYEEFAPAKTWHKAARSALDERVEGLRSEVKEAYENAFDELEAQRERLGVANVLPEREARLREIGRYDSVARLQAEKAQVNEFRATYQACLNDAAQEGEEEENRRESITLELRGLVKRTQVESRDEIDEVVEELREHLCEQVQDGKIVIFG